MDAHSGGGSQNGFHSNNDDAVTYEFVTMHIVIPVVCSFGLLGNLLALVVLLRRVNEGGIEMLEKGSLVAMIGKSLYLKQDLYVHSDGKSFDQPGKSMLQGLINTQGGE